MSAAVILLLAACLANGITEGYHWGGRKVTIIRADFDLYHILTGITLWGFIVGAYLAAVYGLHWYNAIGVCLFGVVGLRDWAINVITRGHPVATDKGPLRVGPWHLPRYPHLSTILALLGGVLCVL